MLEGSCLYSNEDTSRMREPESRSDYEKTKFSECTHTEHSLQAVTVLDFLAWSLEDSAPGLSSVWRSRLQAAFASLDWGSTPRILLVDVV